MTEPLNGEHERMRATDLPSRREPRMVPHFLLLLALLGGAGCHKREGKKIPKPQTVSVIRMEPQTVRVTRDYVGRTEAFLSVDLRPQVTGYITRFYFQEGQFVHKGQRLFQIDPLGFRAQIDAADAQIAKANADILKARAKLEKAKDAAARFSSLAPLDAIPRQQYADALADVEIGSAQLKQMEANRQIAQASLEQAKVQLSYATLRAPISGTAGSRRLVTGGLATPTDSEALVTISQSDPIRVQFAVSDADYLRYIAPPTANRRTRPRKTLALVGKNAPNPVGEMNFRLLLADGSTYGMPGRFYAVSRAADVQTDTVELTVLYPNPDNRLRPGQYAEVRTNVELRKDALLIPVNSVRETQGTRLVWLVGANNKAIERKVEAQRRVGNAYLVTGGLQPGDRVIVGGEQKLRPGDKVEPKLIPVAQLGEGSRDATFQQSARDNDSGGQAGKR